MAVEDVRAGGYVQIGGYRRGGCPWQDRRPDERFARVERVEHLRPQEMPGWGIAVQPVGLFCQGVPGPVVAFATTGLALQMRPDRVEHDEAEPTWPDWPEAFFAGATVARDRTGRRVAHPENEEPAGGTAPVRWVFPRQAGRPASRFAKPAKALLVGDYVQTHVRYPDDDRDTDEGFHRVGWVGALSPDQGLLTQPGWAGRQISAVVVDGVEGVLLLPDTDLPVLIAPNPERQANDLQQVGDQPPPFALAGLTERPTGDTTSARELDRRLRPAPPPDEMSLYPPTVFGTERELLLNGRDGIRLVPLSQLPWPHLLGKCDLRERIGQIARTYPATGPGRDRAGWDGTDAHQAAAAEAFGQITATGGFSGCAYHQANWADIARVAAELVDQGVTDTEQIHLRAATDDRLTPGDRTWLNWLFADPILWSDGSAIVSNGQHRICAMRAAGVTACPVEGRHLPGAPSATVPAADHARSVVETFWSQVVAGGVGTAPIARLVGRLLARHPGLRRFWVRGNRIKRY